MGRQLVVTVNPRPRSNWLRLAAWAAGGAIALALLIAAALLIAGNGLAALKILLFVILTPGIALFTVFGIATVREPGWSRRPADIATASFAFGCVLLLSPILAYMPWAPERFPLDSMPLGLPVIATTGGILTFAGASLGVLLGLRGALLRRDWAQVVSLIVIAALIGWILARAIEARA